MQRVRKKFCDLYQSEKCKICRYFTIVGSKLIKQNGKYHVHVTAKDFHEVQVLNVAIKETEKPDKEIPELIRNITLVNGETQKVEFDVSTGRRYL